jgi:hypothetical protein
MEPERKGRQMKKRCLVLALVGLIVLGMVISVAAGLFSHAGDHGVLPPPGIEKIDTRRMDGGAVSSEGRAAFLNAAVQRLLIRAGPE